MRKKLSKVARTATAHLQPKPIITFDNSDYNSQLITPSTKRGISFNRQVVNKHAQILFLSAAQANSVCLASNQINQEYPLIAINRHFAKLEPTQATSVLTKEGVSWINQNYNNPSDYDGYNQPRIVSGQELVERHQESISFPFFHFWVKRYNRIFLQFRNQRNEKEVKEYKGEMAWIIQQSCGQLQGQILLDWRVNGGNIIFQQQVSQYFPKSISLVQEYTADLRKIFKQYPKLLQKPVNVQVWKKRQDYEMKQQLSFENDYFNRLIKHYGRQMRLLQDRIASGTLNPPKWQRSKKIDSRIIKK